MQPVDDFQKVTAGLSIWQGYDPSVKIDLCSCAVRSGPDLFFIDPVRLAPEPLAELVSDATPAGIILTNGNHERGSAFFRKQFGIPVYAHTEAQGEFEVPVDHWIGADTPPPGGLTAVHLPGAAKGEIALHSAMNGGLLIMGDALIHIEPHGPALLPDKYCLDAKLMKRSLQILLQFSFEAMTFAHGLPVIAGAKKRLEQLLQSS